MANNSLNKHVRSDKCKWILTAVVALLMAVFLAAIGMQLWAPDKYKPSEWGNELTAGKQDKGDDADELADKSVDEAFADGAYRVVI